MRAFSKHRDKSRNKTPVGTALTSLRTQKTPVESPRYLMGHNLHMFGTSKAQQMTGAYPF